MKELEMKIKNHVSNEISLYIAQLKEFNITITLERRKILELFFEESNKHFSAKEIFQYFCNSNINLGLATIYRNLKLFESLDMINKVTLQDRTIKYGFNQTKVGEKNLHFHIICMNCGEIIDYSDDKISRLSLNIEKHTNFKIENIKGEFYGYCKKCIAKNKIRKCG